MSSIPDPSYRPLGLASDENNPNFLGANNPDARLWVKFFSKPMENEFKTLKEGRPIFEDRVFVTIQIPGNQLSIISTFATDDHKRRFPLQWQHYLNTHGNEEQAIGTPLEQWPLLKASQVEELRALKFRTVESVAFASDAQVQTIGMAAGMNPLAFRDRAKLYLEAARDNAVAQKQADENKALLDRLDAEQKARVQLEEKHAKEMAEMRALISQANQAIQAHNQKQSPKARE